MNYNIQEKKQKPNVKNCIWCKNNNECYQLQILSPKFTHKQELKMIKEGGMRYCKLYKFSKQNFKEWKEIRQEKNCCWG